MTQTGQSVSSLGPSLASWVRLCWTNFLVMGDEVCSANTKALGRTQREETGGKTAATQPLRGHRAGARVEGRRLPPSPRGVTALEPEHLTIF